MGCARVFGVMRRHRSNPRQGWRSLAVEVQRRKQPDVGVVGLYETTRGLPGHLKRTADFERVGLLRVLAAAEAHCIAFASDCDAEDVYEGERVSIV